MLRHRRSRPAGAGHPPIIGAVNRSTGGSMLAGLPLDDLLARVASTDPAPGAGPSAAYTGAIAAALVEMVSAIELRKDPDAAATAARREQAAAARTRFLELGDDDVAAYGEVLEVLRRRDEPGHAGRLRDALSRAA